VEVRALLDAALPSSCGVWGARGRRAACMGAMTMPRGRCHHRPVPARASQPSDPWRVRCSHPRGQAAASSCVVASAQPKTGAQRTCAASAGAMRCPGRSARTRSAPSPLCCPGARAFRRRRLAGGPGRAEGQAINRQIGSDWETMRGGAVPASPGELTRPGCGSSWHSTTPLGPTSRGGQPVNISSSDGSMIAIGSRLPRALSHTRRAVRGVRCHSMLVGPGADALKAQSCAALGACSK
jgi:hypothetical protein